MSNKKLLVCGVAAVLSCLVVTVNASDSPSAAGLFAEEYQALLARSRIPVVEVRPGPGRGIVAARLLERLGHAPGEMSDDGNRLVVRSTAFRLVVWASGEEANYRTTEVHSIANLRKLPIEERISSAELEAWGRGFIASKLGDVLPFLKNGDGMILLGTRYQVVSFYNAPTHSPGERLVVSNEVTFGRTVNGIPVVGPGSKIAMEFSNDGTLMWFNYDWSDLQVMDEQRQELVGYEKMRERSAELKLDADASSVRKLECGYFDVGARHRSLAVMQPGCLAQVVYEGGNGVRWARMTTVPVSASVQPESGWPETSCISGESDMCR